MKIKPLKLLFVGLVAAFSMTLASAQTVDSITAGKPYKLFYDHVDFKTPVIVTINSSTILSFNSIDITVVSTNAATTNFTFFVNLPPVEKGQYSYTMVVNDPIFGMSAPSAPRDAKAKPREPVINKISP